MWIPHTVPKSTFDLFAPPDVVGTLPNEVERAVKSEDFGWADRTPRPLRLLCLDNVADDFARYPRHLFESIDRMNAAYLEEKLNTSLPIASVMHVPEGEYWRRRIADTWPGPELAGGLDSYKTVYITRHVSDLIGDLVPGYVDEDELAQLLENCSPHVTSLELNRLRVSVGTLLHKLALENSKKIETDPIHIDLGFVLGLLKNVQKLSLVYGPKKLIIDEGFVPELYRFNVDDMDTLGRGLVISKNLNSLAITKSDLNAVKFNRLLPYLTQCHCLEEINFSYCKLLSLGGKSVAHYIKMAKALKKIELCGNNIGSDAVESLAFVSVWRRNNGYPAIELNLNMNNISDIGAKYLASALASGFEPFSKLHLRNCKITNDGGMNIVRSLEYDRGLRGLELDNNPLTTEVAIALHATMRTNLNIEYLSTQNCNFPEHLTNFLRSVAFYNRHDKRPEFKYVGIEDLLDEVEEEELFQDEESMHLEINDEDKENN